jgi:putative ABC transport system permease protein
MFSDFYQILLIVKRALLSNKTRSFLTMLGIVIGVASVVIIMALGAGAQSLILNQLEGLGNSEIIAVLPGKSDESGPPAAAFGIVITTLSLEDLKALENKNNVSFVKEVAGFYDLDISATWQQKLVNTTLVGVSSNYLAVEGGDLARGRFFSDQEDANLSKVAVLGATVANELFGDLDPIGQRIKLKNQTVEVIGVLEKRGQIAFQNYDDQIIAPLSFVQKQIANVSHLGSIRMKVDSLENIEQSLEEVKLTLRERRNIIDPADDDFSVRSFQDAIDLVTTITNALRYFLAAMAALSLLVGGIGIMNIMLVSVVERTKEIGLRKAIGANNFHIMRQFLLESIFLTLIGGLIGLIVGIFISFLVYLVLVSLDFAWIFTISWLAIFLAIFISIFIGLVFGLFPAKKASQLSPIEALRYE